MDHLLASAPEYLLLLFFVITFLQSGLDKVTNWKGNLGWLRGHFSKTPFKNWVPQLLGCLMVTELAAGFLCLGGMIQLAVSGGRRLALYGAIVCCLALLMLLFGQRMAKDYDGARTIALYFIPAVFLVYLLGP